MRVLIIGALGQLGTALCEVFADTHLIKADTGDTEVALDIRDRNSVMRMMLDLQPDIVVNTAAEHDLPRCEKNPEQSFEVNAVGAFYVAQACKEVGANVIYISTDYVFGGCSAVRRMPYSEQDLPVPLNVYGASKLAGEYLVAATCPGHFVVRTAGLYGLAPCRGKGGMNFVERMLNLAASGKDIRVVDDEFTTPTYTCVLARQIRLLVEKGVPGIYHATCDGWCSWYEFAASIFEIMGVQANLSAAKSHEFQSDVRRPTYTVLENQRLRRLGLDIMPHWLDALKEYAATRSCTD